MDKRIVAGLMVICFLSIPAIASANFFDDGRLYMDSNQWSLITDWDTENRGSLVDSDDKLNWITIPKWSDDYKAHRHYVSKWTLDLKDDFEFAIEFHYDYTGSNIREQAGVIMGLLDESSALGIWAGNDWWDGESVSGYNSFASNIYVADEISSSWKRSQNDGLLWAGYDAAKDVLSLRGIDWNQSEDKYEFTGEARYSKLKTELEIDQLKVFMGGWSDGAGLSNGEAYLENFQVTKGTITPEPISGILFLIGGSFLIALRRGKQKK